MVCGDCGQETGGIKINNKLFCTNCGEALLVPPVVPGPIISQPETVMAPPIPQDPEPAITDNLGQTKTLSDIENDVEVMEAEEEVLDEIIRANQSAAKMATKKKPKSAIIRSKKNKEIVKHNRDRIIPKKVNDYILVEGEPDPIGEPELESPHDMELTENKVPLATMPQDSAGINLAEAKDNIGLALVDEETKQRIKEKNQRHTEVLTNFLKTGASKVARNIPKKRMKNKYLLPVGIILIIILGFLGLVFYVNLYGNKAGPAVKKAESVAVFGSLRPTYVPAGYAPTYLTSGTTDSINYDYEYSPDTAKKLNIIISKTDITATDIYQKKIVPLQKKFSETNRGANDYWIVDNSSLYFVSDNLLYEIVSSAKISEEELIKIADGLL
jgi:DNA-directed RNA polymerase subunit RPC12/RpoP